MDTCDIAYAREHLDELMARASRGEAVAIVDPEHGTMKFVPDAEPVPRNKIVFGLLKGIMPEIPRERLLAPRQHRSHICQHCDWLSSDRKVA